MAATPRKPIRKSRRGAFAWPAPVVGTSSSIGTTRFDKIRPELEACFVQAALVLGTRPMKFRDTKHRAAWRNRYARYFMSVADSLPPPGSWPARLHTRMSDAGGEALDLYEKLAVAYMWWIDEHFRTQPADGP